MSLQTQHNHLSIASLGEEKVELLKRTICKGATNDELELFIHACNRMHLDPFMKQIYAVKRWQDGKEVMTIQTGIDGYRLIAERTNKYMPGRECTFAYKEGKVFSATGYVKKLAMDGQWHEIASTVYWDEYVSKKKDGTVTGMWRDKPHVMLGKCAESSVLRKAFPADLSGVYTKEEMDQADVEPEDRKHIIGYVTPVPEETITSEEAHDIENQLASEDKQYREDLLKYYTNSRKLEQPMTNFFGFPKRLLSGLYNSLNKRREARQKKAEPVMETVENYESIQDQF
jgi:phage recombination protein Bet